MRGTMASLGINQILLIHRAQREAKDGAAAGIGLGADPAAMRLDDGARDRKADAHTVRLAGDERLKQLRRNILGYARTGIGDYDGDHVIGSARTRDRQLTALRLLHRLDGVAYEIEYHLLNLHLVG